MSNGVPETDIYTAEDCEEAMIADERFASPDIYITDDNQMHHHHNNNNNRAGSQGNYRRSVEGRSILSQ